MSWFHTDPLASLSLLAAVMILLAIHTVRWIYRRRQIRSRQRPIALDLAAAPASIRQNIRRSSCS